MKAFLLAAGYGTRLRPITDTLPKCMVPIRGIPLLGWWFRLLRMHGVSEVLVNTHYLPKPVCAYVQSFNALNTGLKASITYEPSLLGSGGTVRDNKEFIGEDQNFFICYADNLTDMNLSALFSAHQANDGILTMALFQPDKPEQCGIVSLAHDLRIVDFEEKPQTPKSNLANAGVYVARRQLFEYFPDKTPLDFGKDVLPLLKGRMYGCKTAGYLVDIGTPENYRKAKEGWTYDYNKNTLEN